jgi:hypothetical protein
MPGTPGGQHIYTVIWGRGARRPWTSGGQQIYTFMLGAGPVVQGPGGVNKYHSYVGPGVP